MSDTTPAMQIQVSATEKAGVKIDIFSGPLMTSAIFDVSDEEAVLRIIGKAFADARRVRDGESLEDVIASNREGAESVPLRAV